MPLPYAHIFRHAVRILAALAGTVLLVSSPPAFSGDLPGSGLWPRIVGTGLLLSFLIVPFNTPEPPALSRADLRRAGGLLIPGLLWTALLPLAGWLVATFLAGLLACRNGGCSARESLLLCFMLCLFLRLGMEDLLEWSLPSGLLFSSLFGV